MIDNEGNVYIYYTRENIQKKLNISKATAIKVFKELLQVHLIKQIKDKHAYRIYLYDIFDDNYKVEKLNKEGTDSEANKVQNLYPNKNTYNNNYKSKSSYSNYEQRQYPDNFLTNFMQILNNSTYHLNNLILFWLKLFRYFLQILHTNFS